MVTPSMTKMSPHASEKKRPAGIYGNGKTSPRFAMLPHKMSHVAPR